MGERYDMGIAEHQVVGCDDDDEHAHHAQHGKCANAVEQEWPQSQGEKYEQQCRAEQRAARVVAGKQAVQNGGSSRV